MLPEKNETYGTQEYWEERYAQDKVEDKTYDWFKNYDSLKPIFNQLIQKSDKVIHLGTGNSTLPEDMYKDGYFNQINVDYSEAVIEHMKERTQDMELMEWKLADIFNLNQSFDSKTFDVAIDKGTLDALLTVKHDPWNPDPELLEKMHSYMKEVCNVLKDNGILIHITFAQPHFRKRFLEIDGFDVETKIISETEGAIEYFAYICHRKSS